MDGRRVTAYGSMLGVAFGGFTWVVVAGGLIHEPVVSLGGVALGSLVWWFGDLGTSRSAYTMLQPILLVCGAAGTALVLWDLLRRR